MNPTAEKISFTFQKFDQDIIIKFLQNYRHKYEHNLP